MTNPSYAPTLSILLTFELLMDLVSLQIIMKPAFTHITLVIEVEGTPRINIGFLWSSRISS